MRADCRTPTIMMCRDAVYDCIMAAKHTFVVSDVDVVKSYYPKTERQEISKPVIYVVCMQWSEEKLTRGSSRLMELPVQIGLHAPVTPTDTDTIDGLVCLIEQLNQLSAQVCGDRFVWLRTTPMSDPNGTPLSFLELHEKHLFQAVFTVFYQAVIR